MEKLATVPVPKLTRPCELGPTSRMPAARAVATIACSAALPSGPVSPKLEAMQIVSLTPRRAQAATAVTAPSPATITMARSGASGRLSRSG